MRRSSSQSINLVALLAALWLPSFSAHADSSCPSIRDGSAPQVAPVRIQGTPYTIETCPLPEDSAHRYPTEIRVLKTGKVVAKHIHTSDPTGGYLSKVSVERKSGRFLAVSIDSGEFCNSLLFFDLERGAVAGQLGCASSSHACRVTSVGTSKPCEAKVQCIDQGSEGNRASQKPIRKKLLLCH